MKSPPSSRATATDSVPGLSRRLVTAVMSDLHARKTRLVAVETDKASPFANTSLKGNYLGGTIPWPDLNVVSLVAADGAGNAQFTSDSSSSSGLVSDQKVSGTYSVDAHGRAIVTISGDPTPGIFYVVSPTRAVFLSGAGGGYLSSFEQ